MGWPLTGCFTLVPPADMQNQYGLWLNVRRDRPTWMLMWGGGR
jgi:hypothetical protein